MDSIEAFGHGEPKRMTSSASIWKRFLLFSAISVLTVWANYTTVAKPVDVIIINTVKAAAGGKLFESLIGEDKGVVLVKQASNFVQTLLYSNSQYPRKKVTRVVLSIDNYTEMAETERNVIHISHEYIAGYVGNLEGEIMGLIYREIGRVWLWDGVGEAPGALIEGMAEYFRLSAGFSPYPSHHKMYKVDDAGTQQIAMSLQFCESHESGFVADLNARMEAGWNTDFFRDLPMWETLLLLLGPHLFLPSVETL